MNDYVEILEGDTRETLRGNEISSIDFVLLDGLKTLHPAILDLVEPRLSKNAIIVADDISLFPHETSLTWTTPAIQKTVTFPSNFRPKMALYSPYASNKPPGGLIDNRVVLRYTD